MHSITNQLYVCVMLLNTGTPEEVYVTSMKANFTVLIFRGFPI